MSDDQTLLMQTRHWLASVVIELNLCPFAGEPFADDRIQLTACHAKDMPQSLLDFIVACQHLDTNSNIETTLIIYPDAWQDFNAYLDLVEMAERLLVDEGYEGIYQLASFHPDYCFADADIDDAANYTNRSPYPMLHLIREQSLEQVIISHPDTTTIPEKNMALTRQLGLKKMQSLLEQCRNIKQ